MRVPKVKRTIRKPTRDHTIREFLRRPGPDVTPRQAIKTFRHSCRAQHGHVQIGASEVQLEQLQISRRAEARIYGTGHGADGHHLRHRRKCDRGRSLDRFQRHLCFLLVPIRAYDFHDSKTISSSYSTSSSSCHLRLISPVAALALAHGISSQTKKTTQIPNNTNTSTKTYTKLVAKAGTEVQGQGFRGTTAQRSEDDDRRRSDGALVLGLLARDLVPVDGPASSTVLLPLPPYICPLPLSAAASSIVVVVVVVFARLRRRSLPSSLRRRSLPVRLVSSRLVVFLFVPLRPLPHFLATRAPPLAATTIATSPRFAASQFTHTLAIAFAFAFFAIFSCLLSSAPCTACDATWVLLDSYTL